MVRMKSQFKLIASIGVIIVVVRFLPVPLEWKMNFFVLAGILITILSFAIYQKIMTARKITSKKDIVTETFVERRAPRVKNVYKIEETTDAEEVS